MLKIHNNRYIKNVKRLILGEPLQYITGRQEFMKLNFKVNKNEVEGIFTRLDIVNKKLYIVKQGYDIDLIISLGIFQQKMDISDF